MADHWHAHVAVSCDGFCVRGCGPAMQEFLLEVQTDGGGTDVSGLALILAQQLEQRKDEEAALLTALRCALQGCCVEGACIVLLLHGHSWRSPVESHAVRIPR